VADRGASGLVETVAAPRLGDPSAFVHVDACGVVLAEQSQYLARIGVPTDLFLRVEQLIVDTDVEHAVGSGDDTHVTDDVLIVVEQISGRVHDAL
jgi:hypothetical protein